MAFEFLDPIVINTSLHNSLALVEEMSHDSNENAISFDHWTPILIGTNSESSLAWLDDSNDVKPNAPPIMEAPSFNLTISYKILILPRKREESSDDDSVTPAKAVSDQDEYDQFLVDLYPNGYDGPKGERVTVTAVGDSKVKTNDQVTVYQSDNKYFATTGGGSGGIPAKTTSTVNTSTGALTIDIYANGFEQTATETGKTAYSLNKAQISTGKEVLVALVNNVYQVVSGSVNEDVAVARLTTTANITLSGAQTLDSVAVANNDIVLVKNQSSSTTNGRYKVNTSGAWTFVDLPSFVVIKEGTLYARTAWIKTATYTYSGLAAIPI
jgi:hypothetical protein